MSPWLVFYLTIVSFSSTKYSEYKFQKIWGSTAPSAFHSGKGIGTTGKGVQRARGVGMSHTLASLHDTVCRFLLTPVSF